MSKSLLIMRHAKSSWSQAGIADYDRPLNDRGRRDAPRMGRWLVDQSILPDRIVGSSANRAKSTVDFLTEATGFIGQVRFLDKLYHAGPKAYISEIVATPMSIERLMMVGHNPGLEELVSRLSGEWVRMPTAAIAWLKIPIRDWSQLESEPAELEELWLPKEIDFE